jgi:putative DNA primase/helicase
VIASEQFQQAIAGDRLPVPEVIHGDGTLYRFSTNGKRMDQSGWYVLYDDGDVPAGAYGCWRSGISKTWCSKDTKSMTPAERSAHLQRMQAIAQQREADKAQRQHDAAMAAAQRWEAALPAPADHPYLAKKGVHAHGTRVEPDGFLIVPMRDTNGKLWNIERINPANFKDKKGLLGGRRTGLYYSIGKPKGVLIVCEGFATGASIHEATGDAVAVAFNAGNLREVAQALHSKYPKLRLILASDDDAFTDGNPGITKATEAARAIGGHLSKPYFGAQRSEAETDFNDLHQRAGLDAVQACIDAAVPVAQAPAFPPLEGADDSGARPDPVPLPDALPPVAPFDPELLPEALRGWIVDIAERMQCPPDFPAVGVITALSGLIGARAVVAPKQHDDWRVVPNLWGLIVGRPGVMKSPALGEVLKPLHRLESTEREQWQAAHEAWELDTKVAELAGKANEKQAAAVAAKDPAKARSLLAPTDQPTEPTMRRYVVNDSTVEALADLLVENPWGLLVYRDEVHGLLCSMDRQGQEGARGFYLTGYDGNQGHAVDRIGRGHSYVPRVCMAMLGGIQPGKVQSYVREAVNGGAGDDGLLQRFGLAVWPDVERDFKLVDRWPDTPAKQAAWAVFERLNGLLPATDDDPQEWRFSPEAQAIFYEWLIPFETGIRGEDLHPALVSHLAKWRKLIPALALIFALMDTPDSGGVIHERELIRALAWAEYLRTHAERLYAAALIPETTGAHALLAKIKGGKLCDGDGVLWESFTPRLVAVKSWAGLNSVDSVRKAAELLADYGWLARETAPTGSAGGRPSERYLIHPALLAGGKA